MSPVPEFDNKQDVSEVTIGSARFLEQNGHRFTYAVYNKGAGKWEPTPTYLYPDQASFSELKDMALKVLLDSRQLQQSMDRLSRAIEKKIGLGGEPPPEIPSPPKSTSPFEDLYMKDIEPPFDVEPNAVEASTETGMVEAKKKPRAPRKRSWGKPKKVTV